MTSDVQAAEDRAVHSKMANRDKDMEGEIYDKVVDLTEYAKRQRWWNRLFGTNSGPVAEKYSVATQIAIGGIANNSGYIQVDWKRVEKDVNKAKKQLKKGTNQAGPELNTFVEKSTEFVKKNIVVTSGFIGGFLLGLAS
ncbi:FUN14 domain-containing protein 1 [Nibea albiflora]|uniref:FUN14 domain-containing protein 1 n=1 Tax=Nibea albiflora TaxID=240163 RepID=A0ACB7EGJ4_NIBAL|nr:FUN14 domain-containing protein 1 [Nibea albiflora]